MNSIDREALMRMRAESLLFNIDPEFNSAVASQLEETFSAATGEPQIALYNPLMRSYAFLALSTFQNANENFSVALTQVRSPEFLMDKSKMKAEDKTEVEEQLALEYERIERERAEKAAQERVPNENDEMMWQLAQSQNFESLQIVQLLAQHHHREMERLREKQRLEPVDEYNARKEVTDLDRDGIPDYRDVHVTEYDHHSFDR